MAVTTPPDSATGMGCANKQQKQHICQALGCGRDLGQPGMKIYCQRKHLCEDCIQAECVRLHNTKQLFRFCFQCGKLEVLECFDGNKRTCRMRLQKRRHSQRQKVQAAATRATPTSRSRRSSLSSSSDAAAAAAAPKAGAHTEQAGLVPSTTSCSFDLQGDLFLGEAPAAAQEPSAAYLVCSAQQVQQQQQPSEAAGSSGSSSRRAPYPAPASPLPSGTQCTGPGSSSLFAGTQQLSASAPSSSLCWGPAAAAAGCCEPLPHLEDLMPCLDDAASLQIMLESELTAAALGAAIANSSNSQQQQRPVDAETRRISQHLAARLVEDSGLFGEPGAAWGPSASGVTGSVDSNPMLQPQGSLQSCLPAAATQKHQQQPALYSQSSITGGNLEGWGAGAGAVVGSGGAAGLFPAAAAAPAAAGNPVWGYQAMCLGMPALQLTWGMAAPAASSTSGPLGSSMLGVTPPAQPPAGLGMHSCSPGIFAAGCGGQLVKEESSGHHITSTLVRGAAACGAVGSNEAEKAERLCQLQQQMCHLQQRVESLRYQLGL